MTAGGRLRIAFTKELRALLPLWSACALTIAAGALIQNRLVYAAGVVAFAIGSVALGAQSIGQEFTCGTLSVLLVQPRERRRLLLVKAGALAPLLLALVVLASLVLFRDSRILHALGWRDFPASALIAACAFFVAPWLTMLSRNTLAGTVFTIVIPPSLLILGDIAGGLKYGFSAGEPIDRLKFALAWWGTLAVCTVAAGAGWRTFARLEAIEGGGRDLHLPKVSIGGVRGGVRSPVVALVGKELRLQQLTFVLLGIYAALALTLWLSQRNTGTLFGPAIALLPLYFIVLAIVAGGLALAEEQQLGTRDTQRLLPVALWKQWTVKVVVALGLALTFGVALPALLSRMFLGPYAFGQPGRAWFGPTVVVVVLTSASLYVSSLSSSGVRAAVMSLPMVAGLAAMVQSAFWGMRQLIPFGSFERLASAIPADLRTRLLRLTADWMPLLVAGSIAALLLSLAFLNYRCGERTTRRVVLQLLLIAALILGIVTVSTIATTLLLKPHTIS